MQPDFFNGLLSARLSELGAGGRRSSEGNEGRSEPLCEPKTPNHMLARRR